MSKKYFWLKLKDDFFTTREVKKLRKIAGGDTYTVIYLKLQLLSIKKEGLLVYEGTENNIVEQLALELDEDEDNVKVTLSFLEQNKLIEQLAQDEYLLNKVPESIGSETGSAERMRRMRNKRNNVTPELQGVTNSYTEIEIEIDKEIELEIDKEIEKSDTTEVVSERLNYDLILDWYKEHCHKLPQIRKLTDARRKTLKRWGDLEEIKEVFIKAGKSEFLAGGENGDGWTASFDWIIKPANRIKILEGNYDKKSSPVKGKVSEFTNYDQRTDSYKDLERSLIAMGREDD